MNKYVWAEATQDYWPEIKTIMAPSYKDAVEKLIIKYGTELDDDKILDSIDDWQQLSEYLNDKYTIDYHIKAFEKVFRMYGNIIVKYGRYVPNQKPHYDELLGILLASDNQYAKGYNLNGKNHN